MVSLFALCLFKHLADGKVSCSQQDMGIFVYIMRFAAYNVILPLSLLCLVVAHPRGDVGDCIFTSVGSEFFICVFSVVPL